tara:strand:+ start:362 stop:598 length:237 start_codon:yes stop_codon:yes gene_type:complete
MKRRVLVDENWSEYSFTSPLFQLLIVPKSDVTQRLLKMKNAQYYALAEKPTVIKVFPFFIAHAFVEAEDPPSPHTSSR